MTDEIRLTDNQELLDSKFIIVNRAFFEHLLACMANQKYINDIVPTDMPFVDVKAMQSFMQSVIDKAYRDGMNLLLGKGE